MSITKNHQSTKTLYALCHAAFPERAVSSITELTEGMFNAAYRVCFADGGASVLKISAADASGLLTNEVNLMQAEVAAIKLAHEHHLPFVAQVQYADFTRTHCSGNYFFMDCLPGQSLNSCRSEYTPEAFAHMMKQVGAFQRKTKAIHGHMFGLLGDDRRFDSQYELMVYLFRNVLHDAAQMQVDLGVSAEEILTQLAKDRPVFEDVKTPSLVHWDMWEGNIFVEHGELCGVIDWERAMWADPLADDRFRRHNRHPAFLEGFGQTEFTTAELQRMAWYDLFLYATMITESFYRQYDNIEGTLGWLRPLFQETWAALTR